MLMELMTYKKLNNVLRRIPDTARKTGWIKQEGTLKH